MTSSSLLYRARWLTGPLYGILLGASLTGLAGMVGIAGALSTQGWMSALIVASVAVIGAARVIGPIQNKIGALDFIDKSLVVGTSCGLILGAYFLVHQQILAMQTILGGDSERLALLRQITPPSEQTLYIASFYTCTGMLLLAVLILAAGSMSKVKSWRSAGDRLAALILLASMSWIMFMGGRQLFLLSYAAGWSAPWQ